MYHSAVEGVQHLAHRVMPIGIDAGGVAQVPAVIATAARAVDWPRVLHLDRDRRDRLRSPRLVHRGRDRRGLVHVFRRRAGPGLGRLPGPERARAVDRKGISESRE